MVEDLLTRLESVYGVPEWRPNGAPLETLVHCILSQHTSDGNAQRAMESLRMRYPDWETIADAEEGELAATVREGGLGGVKARRILAALGEIRRREGRADLACLDTMSTQDAQAYLTSLPGVGPKTAAIVLCFALGRTVLPVDTHVFRVSWRLGLVERRAGEARAHALLGQQVPGPLCYRFHMALIRHGRAVCKARAPRCSACCVGGMCAFHHSQPREDR